MTDRGKSLLDLRADAGEGDDKREAQISDNGASQEAAAVVVAVDVGRHVDGDVGRPRHAAKEEVKAPPHLGDVETEHERYRNQPAELMTVPRQRLELPIGAYTHTHRRTHSLESSQHKIIARNNVSLILLPFIGRPTSYVGRPYVLLNFFCFYRTSNLLHRAAVAYHTYTTRSVVGSTRSSSSAFSLTPP